MSTPSDSLLRRLIGWPSATRRASGEIDPADMGTAIGLEFSMDQPPLPHPAPQAPGALSGHRGGKRNWFGRRRPN